jgi:hypothetical protein
MGCRALGVNSSNSVRRLAENRNYLRQTAQWLPSGPPNYCRTLRSDLAAYRLRPIPAGNLNYASLGESCIDFYRKVRLPFWIIMSLFGNPLTYSS